MFLKEEIAVSSGFFVRSSGKSAGLAAHRGLAKGQTCKPSGLATLSRIWSAAGHQRFEPRASLHSALPEQKIHSSYLAFSIEIRMRRRILSVFRVSFSEDLFFARHGFSVKARRRRKAAGFVSPFDGSRAACERAKKGSGCAPLRRDRSFFRFSGEDDEFVADGRPLKSGGKIAPRETGKVRFTGAA